MRWQAAPPCCHRRTGSEQLSGQIYFQSGGWEGVEVEGGGQRNYFLYESLITISVKEGAKKSVGV